MDTLVTEETKEAVCANQIEIYRVRELYNFEEGWLLETDMKSSFSFL